MFTLILSIFAHIFNLILGISSPQNFPPPLSPDEEKECFEIMKSRDSAESEDARQKLILHNLRLVAHIVRKYYSTGKDKEDLISIGTIGLIKAVDSFSTDNGAKFATYAARCIQNEILMHFRSRKKLAAEVSINDAIDYDRDGNPLTYIDIIACEDNTSEDIDTKMQIEKVKRLMNSVLTEREKQIIILRYGIGGVEPMTQREIAHALNISRSYVSRIEKSAVEKLRDAM